MNLPRGGPEPDAAGFVLAGGQSSRMGEDKATAPFAGQNLVERALGILREAGLPAAVAGARSSLVVSGQVIADREPGLGPLSGICAALASNPAPWAVFLPVDLPLLPAALVAYLLVRARITRRVVTVPSVGGFAETFPVVLHRAVLPALEAELKSGHRGCFSACEAAAASLGEAVAVVPAELLAQSGTAAHPDALPAVCWFLNVNSRADLRRAEACLRGHFA